MVCMFSCSSGGSAANIVLLSIVLVALVSSTFTIMVVLLSYVVMVYSCWSSQWL